MKTFDKINRHIMNMPTIPSVDEERITLACILMEEKETGYPFSTPCQGSPKNLMIAFSHFLSQLAMDLTGTDDEEKAFDEIINGIRPQVVNMIRKSKTYELKNYKNGLGIVK